MGILCWSDIEARPVDVVGRVDVVVVVDVGREPIVDVVVISLGSCSLEHLSPKRHLPR